MNSACPLLNWIHHLAPAALGALAMASPALRAEGTRTTDEDFGRIEAAKYIVNNNVWGKKNSPTGRETVYVLGDASPLAWGARYNWPVGAKAYEVKAYPSIICGWHWGVWSRGSGLPVRIEVRRSILTSGSIAVTNPGVQNVAYDCWFHRTDRPGKDSRPTDELMIWVERFGGAGPLGKPHGRVEIGGTAWELYRGEVGWNVFSFVRVTNAESWEIDVRDFIDYLVSVKGWLQKEKYLTSVQFGSEIFKTDGDGGFKVTDYRCDVR